jgi:hypothetical protein
MASIEGKLTNRASRQIFLLRNFFQCEEWGEKRLKKKAGRSKCGSKASVVNLKGIISIISCINNKKYGFY